MTNRERLLGVVMGALLVLVVVALTYRWVRGTLNGRQQRELDLQKQIAQKQRTVRFGQPVTDRMQVYEHRSLPSDTQAAGTLYQTWLLQSVTEVDLDEANVNAVGSHNKEGVYHQFGFTISGRGDLRQLIRFLHKFYSVDYLHRIQRLNLKRIPDSRRLDLAFSVDALSLPTAVHEKELSPTPGRRLKHEELAAYMERITARNLSGPANRDPEFSSDDFPKAYLQRPLGLTIRAKDPDRWDAMTYSVEGTPLPGATLDAKTGRFEWTPTKTGAFEVTLKITDDGLPPRSSTKKFRIDVAETPEGDAPKPTSLDRGKSAYVTAVTQVDDRRQVWVSLRSEGRLLRLVEGSEFKLGDVTLTVSQIQDKAVEVEAKALKLRWLVSLGQNVADGRPLGAAPGEKPASEEGATAGEKAAPETEPTPGEEPAEEEGVMAEEKPAPKQSEKGDEKPGPEKSGGADDSPAPDATPDAEDPPEMSEPQPDSAPPDADPNDSPKPDTDAEKETSSGEESGPDKD
jgi:hypothetical protein